MVRTVEHYDIESIVLVTGEIRRPPAQVKNATIHDAEIAVMKVHLISGTSENVPFTVYNAENVGREDKEGEDSSEEDEESYARDVKVDRKPSISEDKPAKRSGTSSAL
jgi:aspartyl/asparaginyl-tRNA synthetase